MGSPSDWSLYRSGINGIVGFARGRRRRRRQQKLPLPSSCRPCPLARSLMSRDCQTNEPAFTFHHAIRPILVWPPTLARAHSLSRVDTSELDGLVKTLPKESNDPIGLWPLAGMALPLACAHKERKERRRAAFIAQDALLASRSCSSHCTRVISSAPSLSN